MNTIFDRIDACEDLLKVSIKTEQDWRRIQQNSSAALFTRLDTELESHGQPGDKDALLPYTRQFLDALLDIARPNLHTNGRTADEPCGDEDDVEPFDEGLDRHIWLLSDQRLQWDKEIADRRHSRPEYIEKLLRESLVQHHICDMKMLGQTDDVYSAIDPRHVDHELQLCQTTFPRCHISYRILSPKKSGK